MKLYHKQLSSLADLKRERYLMKYARNVHHLDDLLALNPKMGKKKKKKAVDDEDGENPLSMVSGLLGGGGAAVSGLGLLGNKHVRRFFLKRIPRKTIGRAVKEVAFGYLKWKAIELSYGVIVAALHKRKEKKVARQLADAHHPIHRYGEQEYRHARSPR